MLIIDWMERNVITVKPETSLLECRRIFRKENIHRMPVITENGQVVGVVSRAELKEHTPHAAVARDIVDALDELERVKVKDVMNPNPVTVNYKYSMTRAARLMKEEHVNILPVVDDVGKLVGILTEWTLFEFMLKVLTGGMPKNTGITVALAVDEQPNAMRNILHQVRDHAGEGAMRILSMNSYIDEKLQKRQMLVHFLATDGNRAKEKETLDSLRNNPDLRYVNNHDEIYHRDTLLQND